MICDTCNAPIADRGRAMLVWSTKLGEARIVHKRTCDNKRRYPASIELTSLRAPNGLMTLLSLMEHPAQLPAPVVAELIRRLYVPGYEEVRNHLDAAEQAGVYQPTRAERCPYQFQIADIKAWLNAQQEVA